MCLFINILQIYKKYLKNEIFLSQKIVAQKCGFREPLIFLLNMLYISCLTIKNEPLKSVFLSHVLVAQKCGFREPPKINSSPFIQMAQGNTPIISNVLGNNTGTNAISPLHNNTPTALSNGVIVNGTDAKTFTFQYSFYVLYDIYN